MIRQKNQPLAMLVLFALAMSPLTFLACNLNAYPIAPFGGGGGDAFPHVIDMYANIPIKLPTCGPWCGGFIAYAIGKALDYMIDHWNDPSGCGAQTCIGNASQNLGGALGGGGGDTF